MTVAEYAKYKGISKQAVYDKVRRGTLLSETVDGVKHILESVASPVVSVESSASSKKLKRALKRLNKCKHKLELASKEIQGLHELVQSKDSEIDTLKKTFGLMTVAIEKSLIAAPPEEIIVKAKKDKRREKKKRKNKK